MKKEEQIESQIFSSRDIYLSAALICLKFYCVGVDFQIEGSKSNAVGWFKFLDSNLLQEAKSKYLQGLISVEPRAYVQALHSLKSEVANVHNNPHI